MIVANTNEQENPVQLNQSDLRDLSFIESFSQWVDENDSRCGPPDYDQPNNSASLPSEEVP